jgi:hypothetical protein
MHVVCDSEWKPILSAAAARPDARKLVVSALLFFPRGGSAQVARSLGSSSSKASR